MAKFLEEVLGFIEEEMKGMPTSSFTDPSYKLRLSDALFCAQDVIRNKCFWKALELYFGELQKPTDEVVVLDAGSGTGILGFMALALGAGRCCFLEHNPHALELSRRVANRLGVAERCEFVEGDVLKYVPPETFDLLLSETITSDFVQEDFVSIVEHLLPFGASDLQIIPEYFVLEYQSKNKEMKSLGDPRELSFTAKEGIKDKVLLIEKDAEFVEISIACFLYGAVVVESGMCSSFCNRSTISVEQLSSVWKIDLV